MMQEVVVKIEKCGCEKSMALFLIVLDWLGKSKHRSDSMWGTDYITNPYFLNWKVSRTTIENLRWQLGGKIIHRKIFNTVGLNLNKLHGSQYPVAQCSIFKFFLKLLDQRCWRFFEGYLNNFSTELSSQIFGCPRNFLIQEKQNGNVVSTSHWIRPVQRCDWP